MKACSENAIDEICYEDGPAVCEVVLNVFQSGRARVNRWCSTEGRHEEQNQQCKQNQKSGRQELNCSLLRAICTEPGCFATLAEPGMHSLTLLYIASYRSLKKLRLYLNHAMPQSLSCLWYSTKTHSICGSPLQRSEQLVCAPLWKPIKPKSLLGLNRSPTQYG